MALALLQTALAQKTELTLEDAVTNGGGKLIPKQMTGAQWIPGKNVFTYHKSTSSHKRLIQVDLATRKYDTIVRIEDINPADDGHSVNSFTGYSWVNENTLFVQGKSSGYFYNIKTKETSLAYATANVTANNDVHHKTGQLAFTKNNNLYIANGKDIWEVTNHTDHNIVAGQAIARSEYGISKGTFWSPSGNMLAFYEKDESDVTDYPLLDITTTPGSLKNIKYPMAGQGSEQAAIGIYHTLTKQVVYLKSTKDVYDYVTNLAWDPSEQFVYVAELNRATNHMKLNKYDAVTGDFVATLFEEKNDKWVEPEHAVFFPGNQSDKFVWMSERDGFMNLYLYDTKGKLIRQLTKNKWVAKSIIGADAKGRNIFFLGTGENPTETHVYRVSLGGKQTKISKGEGTHTGIVSSTGNYFLDQFSSPSELFSSFTVVRNAKTGAELFSPSSALNPLREYNISQPEILTIKSTDGNTDLYCRMIKPTDFDSNKKYPVLVYVYGGPHAQMVTSQFNCGAPLWMNYQAQRGYIIFTLDNRGSGNRGWTFESGIHRQLGELEMEDQEAGVNYLKSLPYVDANRMAVHGWSYGGFMTTSLMLRKPDLFKVGVGGGPVTDWAYYEVMYGERYMDTPEENPEGYQKNRVMNHVKNLKGDLLLIHGTVDPTVVMQHNLALVKAFIDEGIQVDFFVYPMHPHNVRGKDRIHLMRKVLTYIEEHLR